jgi:hypothetical protein
MRNMVALRLIFEYSLDLLLPYFFNCDIVFSHLSSVDSRRLQVAFNSCTRYVFNLRRYDHLSTHRNELLGVPLFDYYDFRVLSFFFKLILSQRPGYLFADLIGARSVRTSNFIFPSVSPGSSVLVRGIRLWNQLPLAIKNIRSVAAFERAVMERMRTNLT